jgi:hypothetical protein
MVRLGWEGWMWYGRRWFTDVLLHSSKCYHHEHSTEPSRLQVMLAHPLGCCNFMFPWSCQSVKCLICDLWRGSILWDPAGWCGFTLHYVFSYVVSPVHHILFVYHCKFWNCIHLRAWILRYCIFVKRMIFSDVLLPPLLCQSINQSLFP